VLCDRFADSTRAYQGASGQADSKVLGSLERVVVAETAPDLTFVLDLPAEAGMERARRRREAKGEGADRFEAEDARFHAALREAFLKIAQEAPQRCVVVDASRQPDAVEADIWAALQQHLPQLSRSESRNLHVA
jgi:dTMP kinase